MSISPFGLENFFFRPAENIDLTHKKKELKEIFKTHQLLKDEISRSLKKWMFFVLSREDVNLSDIIDQIIIIRTDILLNPFTSSTINDPVVIENRLWDHASLLECKKYLTLCPYSKKPFADEVKVHELAKSILEWTKSFFEEVGNCEKTPHVFPCNGGSCPSIIPTEEWELVSEQDKKSILESFWKVMASKKVEEEQKGILDLLISNHD